MRQRKEADVGPSSQLRINRQNARRLAVNITSARGVLIGSIGGMASEPMTGSQSCAQGTLPEAASGVSQERPYARLQGSVLPDA